MNHIAPNPVTSFRPESISPCIDPSAFVHSLAAVIGDVTVGAEVFVAPGASLRADEGSPFFFGARCNVQDGVIAHALETHGEHFEQNTFEVEGKRYAIFVGKQVSLAHQCQLHGPVVVEDDAFIGMQAFLFRSRVGRGCVVEPGARLIGVTVAPGRYVSAGMVVATQEAADALGVIDETYPLRALNAGVVEVNTELARAYKNRDS